MKQMKYSINPTATTEVITPFAVENYAKMLEDVLLDNQIERSVSQAMSVESNLIDLACTKNVKAALESMSLADCEEIAGLCNMSCESLAAMPLDEFKAKIMSLSPMKAVASNEAVEAFLGVFIISYFAVLFVAIIGSIAQYQKEQAFVKSMWRKLEQAFPDKNKALDEVVVHMWDAKTMESCLKNLAGVEKFLHNDMKTVLTGNFKLADLEKLAATLWKSDLSYFDPDGEVEGKGNVGWLEWWSSWKTNCPEPKGGSLRELGYTTKSLEDCCNLCSHYCTELMKIKEIKAEANAAIAEHQKENSIGLWKRIKRWWTETKEQKAERKENERILNYKYQAIYNLVWGYKETIKAAATGLYAAALKADRVIKKHGGDAK